MEYLKKRELRVDSEEYAKIYIQFIIDAGYLRYIAEESLEQEVARFGCCDEISDPKYDAFESVIFLNDQKKNNRFKHFVQVLKEHAGCQKINATNKYFAKKYRNKKIIKRARRMKKENKEIKELIEAELKKLSTATGIPIACFKDMAITIRNKYINGEW